MVKALLPLTQELCPVELSMQWWLSSVVILDGFHASWAGKV